MKNWILAGAASAALTVSPVPAFAAANPELPAPGSSIGGAADQAVSAFYASRHGAPLWLNNASAAGALINALQHASLDGLPNGPKIALQAEALLARASTGDEQARADALDAAHRQLRNRPSRGSQSR